LTTYPTKLIAPTIIQIRISVSWRLSKHRIALLLWYALGVDQEFIPSSLDFVVFHPYHPKQMWFWFYMFSITQQHCNKAGLWDKTSYGVSFFLTSTWVRLRLLFIFFPGFWSAVLCFLAARQSRIALNFVPAKGDLWNSTWETER